MSRALAIPEDVPATITRFCGGSSIGLYTPGPCYQIDAQRGHDRAITLTEKEAEIVCKAILSDIRKARKERG